MRRIILDYICCSFVWSPRDVLGTNVHIINGGILPLQSLKSRGIRFPGRDEESLAPIFTPPQSVSRSSGAAAAGSGSFDGSAHAPRDLSGFVAHDVSFEVTKEVLDVARNSVDLLNTVLTSSPQQEVLQVHMHMHILNY